MLLEIFCPDAAKHFDPARPATHGDIIKVYMPPDTERFAHRCYHIDEADWRYLRRFIAEQTIRRPDSSTPFEQTVYFVPPELRTALAGAVPYDADSADAG